MIFDFFGFGLGGGSGTPAVPAQEPDATFSSLTLDPTSTEDGATVTVTVIARDSSDLPIPGATIALSTDAAGVFGESAGVTDASGEFITTYQPSAVGDGSHLISADITSNAILIVESDTLTVTAGNRMLVMTGAPVDCIGVVVTPERFIFALGAGGDSRKVQWPSRETLDDWTPTAENTAGDFTLEGTGRIRCGRRGRGETLIWTDNELFAARWIPGPFVYSFERLGTQCGIIAPNAVAVLDGRAVWMSQKGFFIYDGFVQPVPCEVFDHVFGDFNHTQREKVWAQTMSQYGEVWFFYPSSTSTECDRYVIWNYRENHWSIGQLARTAGVDRGAFDYPMMAAPDGVVYDHERGDLRTGMTPFAESGPVEIAEGESVMKVRRLIPDEGTLGETTVRFFASMYPTEIDTERERQYGPYDLREPTNLRITARLLRILIEEAEPQDWRVGVVKLHVVSGGKR